MTGSLMERRTVSRVTNPGRIATVLFILGMIVLNSGCNFFKTDGSRWLSPEKVVKAPEDAMPVRAIRMNIGPADQTDDLVPNATFPREGDWEYSDEDYVIGPEDVVSVSILDLFTEGLETVLQRQVTESGYIRLPLLPNRIRAAGLTKERLRENLIEAYSPDILRDPTISLAILQQRQNTFSVLGAVARPAQYNIIRRDMRLLESLALAGDITQANIRYIYVIRQSPPKRLLRKTVPKAPADIEKALPPLPKIPDSEAPAKEPATEPVKEPATEPATEGDLDEDALRELGEALKGPSPTSLPAPSVVPNLSETTSAGPRPGPASGKERSAQEPKWRYINGEWVLKSPEPAPKKEVKVEVPPKPPVKKEMPEESTDPFDWKAAGLSGMARIIAVDLDRLRNGNPRMNIVVRDKDVVHVPNLQIGEFYVMGEVLRPGVYSLTGRRVTVKMAIAAAGNFSVLAWPENAVLVRRVGEAEEQMIPLDLERIFRGLDEDVFLKPNDVIAVGTDIRSTFLAVLRNAFRMTYGFGFIYDRNFGDQEVFTYRGLSSNRFKRW